MEHVQDIQSRIDKVTSEVSLTKDTSGYNYKYTKLDQIVAKLREPLAKHNLTYFFKANVEDGIQIYSLTIASTDDPGRSSTRTVSLGYSITDDPQAAGSIMTYSRRYLLLLGFNLIPEDDDDGAVAKIKASGATTQTTRRRRRAAQ